MITDHNFVNNIVQQLTGSRRTVATPYFGPCYDIKATFGSNGPFNPAMLSTLQPWTMYIDSQFGFYLAEFELYYVNPASTIDTSACNTIPQAIRGVYTPNVSPFWIMNQSAGDLVLLPRGTVIDVNTSVYLNHRSLFMHYCDPDAEFQTGLFLYVSYDAFIGNIYHTNGNQLQASNMEQNHKNFSAFVKKEISSEFQGWFKIFDGNKNAFGLAGEDYSYGDFAINPVTVTVIATRSVFFAAATLSGICFLNWLKKSFIFLCF